MRRFVFASSCSVYGSNPSPLVDEGAELQPVSLYALKKAEAERALFALPTPGMAVCALRMATLYGLSPRMRFDLAINLMVMNGVTRRMISVRGGGQQWRPFLHVSDAARAFITALEAPAGSSTARRSTSAPTSTTSGSGTWPGSYATRCPHLDISVRTVPDDADKRSYRVGFGKIADRLGFRPRADLAEGIVEIARAIESGRLGDCSDTRFYTVKHMQELTDQPAHGRRRADPRRVPAVRAAADRPRGGGGSPRLPALGLDDDRAEDQAVRAAAGRLRRRQARHRGQQLHRRAAHRAGRAGHQPRRRGHHHRDHLPGHGERGHPPGRQADPGRRRPDHAEYRPGRAIEAAITPRTKAIIPVHMAGQACRHGRDPRRSPSATAWPSSRTPRTPSAPSTAGERVGNLSGSLAACYSFYPIKNMTTIEGGAILTNDDEFAERCRLYTLHGISKDAWKRYSSGRLPALGHPARRASSTT